MTSDVPNTQEVRLPKIGINIREVGLPLILKK